MVFPFIIILCLISFNYFEVIIPFNYDFYHENNNYNEVFIDTLSNFNGKTYIVVTSSFQRDSFKKNNSFYLCFKNDTFKDCFLNSEMNKIHFNTNVNNYSNFLVNNNKLLLISVSNNNIKYQIINEENAEQNLSLPSENFKTNFNSIYFINNENLFFCCSSKDNKYNILNFNYTNNRLIKNNVYSTKQKKNLII